MTYSQGSLKRRSTTALRGGLVAFVLGAVAVLFWFDPGQAAWFPKCTFHLLTGWHCPGCGSTRAAHALLHGDLQGALACNAMFVCAVPVVLAVSIGHLVSRYRSWAEWTTTVSPRWIWAAVAAAAVFTVLRNVPLYPFDLLAPH